MKIALITDTHFGARNDSQVFQAHFDNFLTNVFFPELEKREIKTLIHLGDLVDRRKYINYVTLNFVRTNFINRLADLGIDTHIIIGNHDTYYKNTNEVNSVNELFTTYEGKVEPWIYHEPTTKNFDGLDICLMPWICSQNYNQCMKELETTKAQVLMGHLEVNGYTMFPGSVCVHGFDREVFSKFDKVYSGHFHYKNGDSTITYIGTPWELMWSDYGDQKGFYIFDTETRETEFIPNPYNIFHKVIYNDETSDMEKYQFENLEKRYVKLIVAEKKNPYIFDRFVDRLYKLNPEDVNIIEDSYNVLHESEDFVNFEAEDTLTTLIKYVHDVEISNDDIDKGEVEDLMKVLYTEAHDYI